MAELSTGQLARHTENASSTKKADSTGALCQDISCLIPNRKSIYSALDCGEGREAADSTLKVPVRRTSHVS